MTVPSAHKLLQPVSYEVFIAAPMSALDPSEYAATAPRVLSIIDPLSNEHGFANVYFARAAISQPEDLLARLSCYGAILSPCRARACLC